MTTTVDLSPISGPSAWRGDELAGSTEWIYHLSDAERAELEAAGRRFVADDPDLRSVTAADYPLDACAGLIEECAAQMDSGRGFVLIRGLRTPEYGDAVASAIFYLMGLHLSTYAGSSMIFSAQDYPEVPRLTEAQVEVLHLFDEIAQEPGLALDMDFQPGDVQWLLNYAALHSRTGYVDYPEPERRRHLLRLWLRRDVGRPLVPGFGKSVINEASEPLPGGRFKIADAAVPNYD